MNAILVLRAAHKAAATGFYKPAVEFLVSDTGKSFTDATFAIGKAIKAGFLAGVPHKTVTLTEKGLAVLTAR